MAGPAEEHTQTPLRPPPPLPRRLLALGPIVHVGTGIWSLAAVLLAIAHYGFDRTPPIWLWTALAGTALGIVGIGIMAWQRHAAGKGAKGAQRID